MTWGMRTNGRTAQSIEYHNWTEAFRALPLIEMDELAGRSLPFWKDWVQHAAYDEYWAAINDEERWGEIRPRRPQHGRLVRPLRPARLHQL